MTMQHFFDTTYKQYLSAKGTRASSISDVQSTLNKWNDIIGAIALDAIADETIWHFAATLSGQKNAKGLAFSPNTTRKHLRNIRAILRYALKRRMIGQMPDIIMPKERFRGACDSFTFSEIQTLIQTTSMFKGQEIDGMDAAEWWKQLIVFLYCSACRVGTATKARFDWVHGNRLEIAANTDGVKTCYDLPLGNEAQSVIGMMRRSHKESRIFPNPHKREWLHRRFRELCEEAGIPPERRFGFHGIRKHTGSVMATKDFAAAVKLLGHSDPKVTARYYLNPEIVCEKAVERIPPLHHDGIFKRVWKQIVRLFFGK